MHLASIFPSLSDWGGIIGFLAGNPGLFIHQTTVVTAELELSTFLVRGVGLVAPIRAERFLDLLAPTLWVMAWIFGLGALVLSTEIFLRFHQDIPSETETQLASGIGHFAFGAIMVWQLGGWWKRASRNSRAASRFAAGFYFLVQVWLFEPPWFSFQGQREMVLWFTWISLTVFVVWATLDLIRFNWESETDRAFRAADIKEGNS